MGAAVSLPQFCRTIVNASEFKVGVMTLIIIAGLVVGLQTYPSVVGEYELFLTAVDRGIMWLFCVEIVLRIVAHWPKPHTFFKDSWNNFDFIIVALCILPVNAAYLAVLRLVRVLRVLRLLSALPNLQLLVGSLLKAIPSIGYISLLLLLEFYVYACLGVFMFGGNDPVHFGNLHRAMITLFQIVTLEGWIDVMNIQYYGSDIYSAGTIGMESAVSAASPLEAIIYFISFIFLGTMVVLNLFIGVIINGMSEMHTEVVARKRERLKDGERLTKVEEMEQLLRDMDKLKQSMQTLKFQLEHENEASKAL